MCLIALHYNICSLQINVKTGPWSNRRRLSGPMNYIFFYIAWTAGYAYPFDLGKWWHQDALWGSTRASGAMFCWETLGLGIHVAVNFTYATYLYIVADHVHPFKAMVSFSRIIHPDTWHTLFRNSLRNMMKNIMCCPGQQISQISPWASIYGMCEDK